MKQAYTSILSVAIVFAFLAPVAALAKQLPFESIRVFKVATIKDEGNESILINGMCLESAYVVTKVDVKNSKEESNIVVNAGMNVDHDKAMSGSFSVRIPKTSELKKITYGENREIIWSENK